MAKKLEEVVTPSTPVLGTRSRKGVWGWIYEWLTTVDHKRIGLIYMTIGIVYLAIGGVQALMMRAQLAAPNNELFTGNLFNQLMTLHGTNMIFFAAMPLLFGLFNYIVPLQIGARDVAFPFMNALSVWLTFFGALLVNICWFFGDAPAAGWFAYVPLGLKTYSPGPGMDFFVLGLQIAGFGTLMGAINFIVTILNMRAPGMTLMRMPLFTWTALISSVLVLFGFPPLTIGLFLYSFERIFGGIFFDPALGGNPILWQHFFWIFGHPEVYIVILPAFGIISEVMATFSHKRIFGYPTMVVAIVLIGFIGMGVWVHHMFTVGLGGTINSIFAVATMLVGIPTGIKVFNWLFTMWGGKIRFTTPMLFAIGFIPTFVIAGVTGVMLASAPADYQYQDSYFVIAHFHYTLYGGVVFAVVAALYYWFPKFFGRMMHEGLGKWNFWLMFIGFHLTFFPMHFSGIFGMPRRVYTYNEGVGLELFNLLSTIGAYLMGLSVVLLVINIIYGLTKGPSASNDPWGTGRTLEWAIPSPVPEYNFAQTPYVRGLDAWWIEKTEGKGQLQPAEPLGPIHMPSPSILPFIMAFGMFIAGLSLIFHQYYFTILGLGIWGICMIIRSMNHDEGYYIPVEKIRSVEGEGA